MKLLLRLVVHARVRGILFRVARSGLLVLSLRVLGRRRVLRFARKAVRH